MEIKIKLAVLIDSKHSGMDVNCGSYLQKYTKSAVQQGKVDQAQIDRALENLFAVRMRLGLFDGTPSKLVYGSVGPDQVCSPEHRYLALKAAQSGIVLLKNDAKLLPFPKGKTPSLAVIGPNADAAETLLGNYHGPPCIKISPLRALQSYVKNTRCVFAAKFTRSEHAASYLLTCSTRFKCQMYFLCVCVFLYSTSQELHAPMRNEFVWYYFSASILFSWHLILQIPPRL